MRWLLVMLVACSAPPRAATVTRVQPQPAPAVRDLAVAEPAPKKPVPEAQRGPIRGARAIELRGNPLLRDETIVLENFRHDLQPVNISPSELWSRCVRDFITAQPDSARRALTEMLDHYITTCDGEGRVVLSRPLGPDGRERPAQSDLTFVGTLGGKRVDVSLHATLCGDSPDADQIAITTDGDRWMSPRIEVEKDDHGCDVVELPLTRAFARVLRRIVDAHHATVVFQGLQRAQELNVGDELKRDLAITLDALDVLDTTTRP